METWSSLLDFCELKCRFGSPMYVLNEDAIIQNFTNFSTFADRKNIYFPVKANPHPYVISLLATLGSGFDCASEYEIDLVLNCQADWKSIIYNSPVLNISLAEKILKKGGKVVINSSELYEKLENCLRRKFLGDIFLRWNPSVGDLSLENPLAHGSFLSKFGISSAQILKICKQSQTPISGLHTHVGSRINDLNIFVNTLNRMHSLSDQIEETSIQRIKYLNLGGGLGIDLHKENEFPSVQEYANVLNKYKNSKYTYCIEPGNALIGNAIGLLCSLLEFRKNESKRWGFVDVGANQFINWIALKSPHRILQKNKKPLSLEGPDSLGGPLCFAGDILFPQTNLEGLEIGEPLFIQHCGSYCYALGNHFNGFLSPGWLKVDLKNNKSSLIQSKEYPNFVRKDSILKVSFNYDH